MIVATLSKPSVASTINNIYAVVGLISLPNMLVAFNIDDAILAAVSSEIVSASEVKERIDSAN